MHLDIDVSQGMASSNPNQTVSVNVNALSNALAVAIQQATVGTSQPQQVLAQPQAGQTLAASGSSTRVAASSVWKVDIM